MTSTMQMPQKKFAVAKLALADPEKQVTIAYMVFLAMAAVVYFIVANRQFASIQTVAGMTQCFSIVLLAMQVCLHRSVEGISGNSLAFHALAFACRLSGTTWLNGYLPVDASGDWIYQAFDVFSLLLTLGLFARVTTSSRKKIEILGVVKVFVIAFGLASLLHANMDKRPLFDTLWMTGVFLTSVAMLPQLLVLHKLSAAANPLAGHALIVMAMSQILSAIYMWHARNDMTCDRWIEDFNHAAWAVLIAHILPVLAIGHTDFSQEWSRLA